MDLTFGEQVKILLKRRKMTIKDLADMITEATGRKMSRQNLTQQLGRDNFQEQDMRMIAGILGCSMQVVLVSGEAAAAEPPVFEERYESRGLTQAAAASVKPAPQPVRRRPRQPILGDVDPKTGEEYKSNTVRTHPVLRGYVQVYDSSEHKWIDLVEEEFLKFQEEKHTMMGKEYEPPVYID